MRGGPGIRAEGREGRGGEGRGPSREGPPPSPLPALPPLWYGPGPGCARAHLQGPCGLWESWPPSQASSHTTLPTDTQVCRGMDPYPYTPTQIPICRVTPTDTKTFRQML